jgi:putative tricarboxylic transport membrane protein
MRKPRARALASIFAGAAIAFTTAASAAFPERAIEFVIPFGAGGGADIEGRVLAKEMSRILGVPVVAINKPGAGGAVTYTYVKNAKPDGYTMAWNSTSILTTTNIGNVPFDQDALDHIGRVEYQPMPFAVRADAKWQSLRAFAADCKARPGTLKIANSGTGSATHLAAIAIVEAIGCKVIHLPVGIKRRNASVLSGEADAMVAPLTGALRLAKAGKLRLLAIPSAQRNAVIKDVPTAREQGADAVLDLFRGLSVPKGTPAAVKAKLASAMTEAARSPAFMKLAAQKGFTVAPLPVAEFESLLRAEDAKIKAIMKSAGLYRSKRKGK